MSTGVFRRYWMTPPQPLRFWIGSAGPTPPETQTISPSGIASTEAFGTDHLNLIVFPSAIGVAPGGFWPPHYWG